MIDKHWYTKARQQILEEREDLRQFRKTYTPPTNTDDMIAFIENNDVMIFHVNLHNIPDIELKYICSEIAWLQSKR